MQKLTRTFLLRSLILILLIAFGSLNLIAQTTDNLDLLREKISILNKQTKLLEMMPLVEKLIIADPKDPEAQFQYGFCLLAKAKVESDKNEAAKLNIRARKAFIKSKELGQKDKIVDALIGSLPEDGIMRGSFSINPIAEELMNAAEVSFSSGKMDDALQNYQKALKLDPTIYEAALFSGDVYVQKDDFKNAEIWYQRAISIDPNRETAYRYSATPLMKQKKYDLARDRYVEAYISEPFSQFSTAGLTNWAKITSTDIGHPRIDIAANVGKGKNGNTSITLNLDDKTDDGSFVWTAYGLARATWQPNDTGLSENFRKNYPNEKSYRHSLAEEFDALKLAVATLKSRMKDKDNPVKTLNPQLAKLIKLYDDGLLEPFILLAKTDEGIFQDYAPYLKTNRDKLRRYVVEYVLTAGGN